MPQLSANQVLGFVLLDLRIILVLARLVRSLFVRIGQPRVVGEMSPAFCWGRGVSPTLGW